LNVFNLKARLLAGFLISWILLPGCTILWPQTHAIKEQRPPDLAPRVELTQVPFVPQEDNFCGPSALAMVLNAEGVNVSLDTLIQEVYLPGREGSLQVEMLAAVRRHGLVAYLLAPKFVDVLREVAAGTPVITLENYGFSWYPKWHYSVMIGYDLDTFEVIRRSGERPRRVVPMGIFEKVWKPGGYWAMVAMPPGRVPVTATETEYAAAVVALEKTGQIQSAFIAYNAMLERWPDSLAAQMGRGNTAYMLHDLDTAAAAFRRAATDHADSAAAFNNLAQVFSDQGRLDEALRAAEHAVSLGGPLLPQTQATLNEIRNQANTRTPPH
jgi:hypothetical protein